MYTFSCPCDKHKSSAFVYNLWISLLLQYRPIFCTHLVPAFERILPPLHQVALTDPGDAEVDRRARTCTYVHLVQVVHHFPVTGLVKKQKKMGRCYQEEEKIKVMHCRGCHSVSTCFEFLIEPVLLLREWPGLNVLPGDFSMLLTTDWLLLRGGGHT